MNRIGLASEFPYGRRAPGVVPAAAGVTSGVYVGKGMQL